MIETATYLGPARVTAVEGPKGRVHVRLPSGEETWARLALAASYTPSAGDEVLLVGQDELYVIGVLRGSGTTTLRVPGNLAISAPHGAVTITAREGVRVRSEGAIDADAPVVRLRAGRLEMTATRIVQSARELYGWFTGLLQLKSRRLRAIADATAHLKSQEMNIRAVQDVHVNGETINLG